MQIASGEHNDRESQQLQQDKSGWIPYNSSRIPPSDIDIEHSGPFLPVPTLHAFDYLAAPGDHPPPAVVALFGDEPFLKRIVLGKLKEAVLGNDPDAMLTAFDGDERAVEWRDVHDELATLSLFGGGGRRLVVVQRADSFVSAQRQRLEDYAAKPKASSVLVLDVETWAANTRLYKSVDQTGLNLDCAPPQKPSGRNKVLDDGRMVKWLIDWAQRQHQFVLAKPAAEALLELVGPTFGLLDQDLAKLALFATEKKPVTAEMVQDVVGGWRTKSTWDMIDAACDGNAAEALTQLDHLLQSGEHPLALFGQIAWSLRRYAAATRAFQRAHRRGERVTLRDALLAGGFKDWPQGTLAKAEERLKQLGRHRAGRIYEWLLEADLAMKGTHSHEQRARWVLEQLVLRLSKEAKPAASGS